MDKSLLWYEFVHHKIETQKRTSLLKQAPTFPTRAQIQQFSAECMRTSDVVEDSKWIKNHSQMCP